MMLEGLRGYMQLASGLTEMTRQRAMEVAKSLISSGGAGLSLVVPEVRSEIGKVADELLATGASNRAHLAAFVAGEIESAVARLGLVSAEDLRAERDRGDGLEARVRQLEVELGRLRPVDAGTAGESPRPARARRASSRPASSTSAPVRRRSSPGVSPGASSSASPRASSGPPRTSGSDGKSPTNGERPQPSSETPVERPETGDRSAADLAAGPQS